MFQVTGEFTNPRTFPSQKFFQGFHQKFLFCLKEQKTLRNFRPGGITWNRAEPAIPVINHCSAWSLEKFWMYEGTGRSWAITMIQGQEGVAQVVTPRNGPSSGGEGEGREATENCVKWRPHTVTRNTWAHTWRADWSSPDGEAGWASLLASSPFSFTLLVTQMAQVWDLDQAALIWGKVSEH